MPRKSKTAPNQRIRTTRKTAEPIVEEPIVVEKSRTSAMNLSGKVMPALAGLATVYFIAWTLIGLFVLLVIVQGIRRGQYNGLLGSSSQAQQTPLASADTGAQTEVNLPGIGMVNVSCVQQALSADSLQKVIQQRSIDVLSGDEKTRFQACITKPEASASASPATSGQ